MVNNEIVILITLGEVGMECENVGEGVGGDVWTFYDVKGEMSK